MATESSPVTTLDARLKTAAKIAAEVYSLRAEQIISERGAPDDPDTFDDVRTGLTLEDFASVHALPLVLEQAARLTVEQQDRDRNAVERTTATIDREWRQALDELRAEMRTYIDGKFKDVGETVGKDVGFAVSEYMQNIKERVDKHSDYIAAQIAGREEWVDDTRLTEAQTKQIAANAEAVQELKRALTRDVKHLKEVDETHTEIIARHTADIVQLRTDFETVSNVQAERLDAHLTRMDSYADEIVAERKAVGKLAEQVEALRVDIMEPFQGRRLSERVYALEQRRIELSEAVMKMRCELRESQRDARKGTSDVGTVYDASKVVPEGSRDVLVCIDDEWHRGWRDEGGVWLYGERKNRGDEGVRWCELPDGEPGPVRVFVVEPVPVSADDYTITITEADLQNTTPTDDMTARATVTDEHGNQTTYPLPINVRNIDGGALQSLEYMTSVRFYSVPSDRRPVAALFGDVWAIAYYSAGEGGWIVGGTAEHVTPCRAWVELPFPERVSEITSDV